MKPKNSIKKNFLLERSFQIKKLNTLISVSRNNNSALSLLLLFPKHPHPLKIRMSLLIILKLILHSRKNPPILYPQQNYLPGKTTNNTELLIPVIPHSYCPKDPLLLQSYLPELLKRLRKQYYLTSLSPT